MLQHTLVEIHKSDAWRPRRELAAIKKITRADPDIQMVCCNVSVVVFFDTLRRASPNKLIRNDQHYEVVGA